MGVGCWGCCSLARCSADGCDAAGASGVAPASPGRLLPRPPRVCRRLRTGASPEAGAAGTGSCGVPATGGASAPTAGAAPVGAMPSAAGFLRAPPRRRRRRLTGVFPDGVAPGPADGVTGGCPSGPADAAGGGAASRGWSGCRPSPGPWIFSDDDSAWRSVSSCIFPLAFPCFQKNNRTKHPPPVGLAS